MKKEKKRKSRATRDQIANIHWITGKAIEFQKNIYLCFIDYAKASDCVQFSSIQLLSRARLFATPWTAARQASLSITNSWNLLRLISIESVMPSNHLILCHPLFLLPSVFTASRSFPVSQFFTSGGQSIGVSASASVLPVTIQDWFSFRMDWLDLLAVQRTLKSLPQHHSSKASVLRHSAFFLVQLSHLYMTTGKTIALTIWTFEAI